MWLTNGAIRPAAEARYFSARAPVRVATADNGVVRRLVDEVVVLERGRVQEQGRVLDLITHTYPLAAAGTAFTMLHESPEQALQVLLSFEEVGA